MCTLCGQASHTCWTPRDLSPENPAGSREQASLLLHPFSSIPSPPSILHIPSPPPSSFCFPHITHVYLLCRTLGSRVHKASLLGPPVPATARGIPWKKAKPLCHSLLLWCPRIAVSSLEAVAPCQGPGHSGFTHTFLSVHITPQLSILRSKYAIFFLPVIFPAVAVDVRAAGECE